MTHHERLPRFPGFRLGTVLVQWLSIIGALLCTLILLSNTTPFGKEMRDALKPAFERLYKTQ